MRHSSRSCPMVISKGATSSPPFNFFRNRPQTANPLLVRGGQGRSTTAPASPGPPSIILDAQRTAPPAPAPRGRTSAGRSASRRPCPRSVPPQVGGGAPGRPRCAPRGRPRRPRCPGTGARPGPQAPPGPRRRPSTPGRPPPRRLPPPAPAPTSLDTPLMPGRRGAQPPMWTARRRSAALGLP